MLVNHAQRLEAAQRRLESALEVAFARLGRVGAVARDACRAAEAVEDGGGCRA